MALVIGSGVGIAARRTIDAPKPRKKAACAPSSVPSAGRGKVYRVRCAA